MRDSHPCSLTWTALLNQEQALQWASMAMAMTIDTLAPLSLGYSLEVLFQIGACYIPNKNA